MKAFISYMSEDRDRLEPILYVLRAAGCKIWFDRDALRGGDHWWEKIKEAIADTDLFVCVFSRHNMTNMQSTFFREMNCAAAKIDRGEAMTILPVFLDDVPIPPLSVGKARMLSDIQVIPFYKDWKAALAKISAAAGHAQAAEMLCGKVRVTYELGPFRPFNTLKLKIYDFPLASLSAFERKHTVWCMPGERLPFSVEYELNIAERTANVGGLGRRWLGSSVNSDVLHAAVRSGETLDLKVSTRAASFFSRKGKMAQVELG